MTAMTGATSGARNFQKVPPRDSSVWKTPMFEQYWRIKETISDALLFYRMGDFYELFGQDAITAAPILEVQLTARDKDAEIPVPMCGVPFHAWDSYAERILSKGLKIALCEQLSEPGKTKLVERGVVRILTPGLPVDFKKLDAKAPHFFASVSILPSGTELCLLDFLGGQYFSGVVNSPEHLKDIFAKSDPKEILLPMEQLQNAKLRGQCFLLDPNSAYFKRITPWAGKVASKNLAEYLLYTQRCVEGDVAKYLPEAKPLRDLTGARESDYATIPANVIEQWDLFPALFDLIDGAGSALGSRRLRNILCTPLKNVERIHNRQKLLQEITPVAKNIYDESREVYDIERILGRFRIGAADPKELLRFLGSFEKVFATFEAVGLGKTQMGSDVLKEHLAFEKINLDLNKLTHLEALMLELNSRLNVDIDVTRMQSLSELLKEGFDAELDDLKLKAGNSQKWLEDFEESLKKKTDISTLKIRFNKVFGYYIEVTKTHLSKVPTFFERKQTTVNGERFTCEELRSKESEILGAQSKLEAKSKEILRHLERHILDHNDSLKVALETFSWLDAWAGFSIKCEKLQRWGKWTYPEVKSGAFYFEVEELRHPILESLMQGAFVPATLKMTDKRILLLTGPNMAGKSTLMRELGLGVLLAQCGLRVPANQMQLAPCSGFYSRMGATDKILEGDSTFMVEMKESARILNEADSNAFVLIDEIGRGTSTQDGLAIAQAVLEHLHNHTGALCLFATHYHELSEWGAQFRGVQNASMAIQVSRGDLHFLRTLEFKPAESSYGIFVARMAGLPKSLLGRAEKYFAGVGTGEVKNQLDIFSLSSDSVEPIDSPDHKVVQKIRNLALDDMSPKQAWALLESLKNEAEMH